MTVKISGKNTWIVLLCFPIKLLGKLYCEISDIWKTLIQNVFIVFKNIYSILLLLLKLALYKASQL